MHTSTPVMIKFKEHLLLRMVDKPLDVFENPKYDSQGMTRMWTPIPGFWLLSVYPIMIYMPKWKWIFGMRRESDRSWHALSHV